MFENLKGFNSFIIKDVKCIFAEQVFLNDAKLWKYTFTKTEDVPFGSSPAHMFIVYSYVFQPFILNGLYGLRGHFGVHAGKLYFILNTFFKGDEN